MGRKAVLFDLYGTLLVPGGERARSGYEAIEGSGFARALGLAGAGVREFCDGMLSTPARRPRDDGLTIFEGRWADRARLLGYEVSMEAASEAAQLWVTAWQQGWVLDRTAAHVIDELRVRGYATALVTNFDHWPHIDFVLANHGLAASFDTVTVSGHVGIEKPDPRIFWITLDAINVAPGDAIHVGDDDVDIRGAIAAGIQPIRIVRRAGEPGGDEQTVHRLAELLDRMQ